jgi:excinuclease UvrABC nuclease subunit
MPFLQQEPRPFTREGIERISAGQKGVYALYNTETCVYVGKADDIRQRLLEHLNKRDNLCILRERPIHFIADVSANAETRLKQLMIELKPLCTE